MKGMLTRRIVRIVLAFAVGLAAVVALSASAVAAIVAGVTLTAVVFDVTSRRPQPAPRGLDAPLRLTVDLSRRA